MGIDTIEKVMERVVQSNPGETEFQQAVREVFYSIRPALQRHSQYGTRHLLEMIAEPERLLMFRVPWRDDKGQMHVNRGYRVEFSRAMGPYKGGLRFHPSVNLNILKFLGFEQIFKNSLANLPMGGGKGGSDFDPKGRSDDEVMRFCESYMTELSHHICAKTDVPAGDIGVGEREIGFMLDQYKCLCDEFSSEQRGKVLKWGDSLIWPEATGYGTIYFTQEMLANRAESIEGKVCVVSGSGNAAQHTVEKAIELGAKVVSMSDSNGTVYDKSGIDQEKLGWIKELKNKRRGRIREYADQFTGAEYFEAKRPWVIPCQCAFPCATQNELSGADANELVKNGCMLVVEAANMPSEPDAVQVFLHSRVLFGPGKAANAGGVAVSGLEIEQKSSVSNWTREEMDRHLRSIMKSIYKKAHATAEDYGVEGNYVAGANIAGFIKVADAMLAQGVA